MLLCILQDATMNKAGSQPAPEKSKRAWAYKEIERYLRKIPKFCGSFKINIFKGGASNINIEQSIQKPEDEDLTIK